GAELAALGHGFEEVLEAAREGGDRVGGAGARPRGFQQPGEQLAFQEADVLGEHAEHQLHEEAGGAVRVDLAVAQVVGQGGELLGDVLGDVVGRLGRLEDVGYGEDVLEQLKVGRLAEMVEVEAVDLLGGVGEVGVNLETLKVADDEQRRIFEV